MECVSNQDSENGETSGPNLPLCDAANGISLEFAKEPESADLMIARRSNSIVPVDRGELLEGRPAR